MSLGTLVLTSMTRSLVRGEGRVVRSPPENWHRPPYVDTELSIPEHWGLVVDYSYPVASSLT